MASELDEALHACLTQAHSHYKDCASAQARETAYFGALLSLAESRKLISSEHFAGSYLLDY
jgi:hypothetical protein